ncbi:hypothetical protein NWE55_16695 (plasmid) [Myroides albus]|nr:MULTISPECIES: hypothetical protein [Myroides]UVD81400.1 hypothetical protein NWE55_16695 [Myroides albus]
MNSVIPSLLNSLMEKYKISAEDAEIFLNEEYQEQTSKSTYGGASYTQIIQIWLDTLAKGESIKLDMFLITKLPFIRIPHLTAVLGFYDVLLEMKDTYNSSYISFEEKIDSICNTVDNNIYKTYDNFVIPISLNKVIQWGLYQNLEVVSSFFSSKENKHFTYDYNDFKNDEIAINEAKKILENTSIDVVYFNIIGTPFAEYESESLFTIPFLIENIHTREYNKNTEAYTYTKLKAASDLELLEFILNETSLYDQQSSM